LYMIGGLSISAFPLFSGFVSKSMIVTAAAEKHLTIIRLILSISSAGTFLHAGLKLPWFTFFGKDSGIRTKEPPVNMLIAMGIAAVLCTLIGIYPDALYNLLPFDAGYVPYTAEHIVWTLQILLFTGLGFFLLLKQLGGEPYISMDTDWFYRKGAKAFMWFVNNPMVWLSAKVNNIVFDVIPSSLIWAVKNPYAVMRIASDTLLLQLSGPDKRTEIQQRIKKEKDMYPGTINIYRPVGLTVLLITLLLMAYLLVFYLKSR